MPASHRLLRCHRPRQPRSGDQDDHHARRCLWGCCAIGSAAEGTAMSVTNSGQGDGNERQVGHTAEGMALPAQRQHSVVPLALEVIAMSKRFGAFVALDQVSMRVPTGSVHALLGENGAGKSTLVKCIMGYHRPDDGDLLVWGRERTFANPREAHALGIGMVYQHFTLVPNMTVAENLLLARPVLPAVIRWAQEFQALEAFMATMPFKVDLSAQGLYSGCWGEAKSRIAQAALSRSAAVNSR